MDIRQKTKHNRQQTTDYSQFTIHNSQLTTNNDTDRNFRHGWCNRRYRTSSPLRLFQTICIIKH